jgi:hypothetical protein
LQHVPEGSDSVARIDLKFDGHLATLVPVHLGPSLDAKASDVLYAFADDGRVLWNATTNITLPCGNQTFSGPWYISEVLVSESPGPRRIWVAFIHNTWWPSIVFEISADGSPTMRYVQAGWILSLSGWDTASGFRIAAGGVMNEYRRASVAWFDPNGPPATSPSDNPFFGCSPATPAAKPDRVILFPQFEVPEAEGSPYVIANEMRALGSQLRVEIGHSQILAFLAQDEKVSQLSFSDNYWVAHRALEATQKLTHSAEACPERTTGVEIRSWTAAESWRSYTVRTTDFAGTGRR